MTTVLLVEDNEPDAQFIQELFRELRSSSIGTSSPRAVEWELVHEKTLADSTSRLSTDEIDIVLLDLNLPDSRGLDTVDAVLSTVDEQPVVVLTGMNDEQIGATAIERGAQDYLVKDDVNPTLLHRTIRYALERQEREATLARREQTLRKLQTTTDELLQAQTLDAVASYVVSCGATVLGFPFVDMLSFDETHGALTVISTDEAVQHVFAEESQIDPGTGPLWEAYRTGETTQFGTDELDTLSLSPSEGLAELVAIPIGEDGLLLGGLDDSASDSFDIELAELLAANAQAALERLQREQELREISKKLTDQEARVHELEAFTEAVHGIQQRIAESTTRTQLEQAVCDELVRTDRVTFAWIGRPRTTDTDLVPETWAGPSQGFLDIGTAEDAHVDRDPAGGGTQSQPAIRAARTRNSVTVSSISAHVRRAHWAKEALSREFHAAISIPLLYDDVLYGVLTAYSTREGAFDGVFEELFTDVGSLLANSISIRERRQFESTDRVLELQFGLSDPSYVLDKLATETGCELQFDTVLEATEESVRLLVTVLDGDSRAVLDRAATATEIQSVEWFGEPDTRQFELVVTLPSLATRVRKHGGRLVSSVSTPDQTRVTIELPATAAARPLIDALTTHYSELELLSRTENAHRSLSENMRLPDRLTDRQFEILRAAYYGGYFETPKGITGGDIAASFGISDAVVYNHLRAAQRTLLADLFESGNDSDAKSTIREEKPIESNSSTPDSEGLEY